MGKKQWANQSEQREFTEVKIEVETLAAAVLHTALVWQRASYYPQLRNYPNSTPL
jgi:hypothetical protein